MPQKRSIGEGENFSIPSSEAPLRVERAVELHVEEESERDKWEQKIKELKEAGLLTDQLLERLKILMSCDNARDWEVLRDISLCNYDTSYEQCTNLEAVIEDGEKYSQRAHELLSQRHNRTFNDSHLKIGRTLDRQTRIPDWNEIQKYASTIMLELLLEENTAERLLTREQRARLDATMTTGFVQSGRPTAHDYPGQVLKDPTWMVKSIVDTLRGGILKGGGAGPSFSHIPTTLWRRDFLTILRRFAEDDELRPFIFTWPLEAGDWEGSSYCELVSDPKEIDDSASNYGDRPLTQRDGIFYHKREVGEVTQTNDIEKDERITKIGMLNRRRVQDALEQMRAMLPGVIEQQEQRHIEELAQLRARLRAGELKSQLVEIAKITEQIIKELNQREQLVGEYKNKNGGEGIAGTLKRAIYGNRLEEIERAIKKIDRRFEYARDQRRQMYCDILQGVYGIQWSGLWEQSQQQPEISKLTEELNGKIRNCFVSTAMDGKTEEARQGLDSLVQELIAEMDKTIAREQGQ